MAAIAYNPKLVPAKEAPKTWQDVLESERAGAISARVSTSGLQHVGLVHAASALRRGLLDASSPRCSRAASTAMCSSSTAW